MTTSVAEVTRISFIHLLVIIFLIPHSYSSTTEKSQQFEVTFSDIKFGSNNATNYTFELTSEGNDSDSSKTTKSDADFKELILSDLTSIPDAVTESEKSSELPVPAPESPKKGSVRAYYSKGNGNPEDFKKELSLTKFIPEDSAKNDKVHYQGLPIPGPWTWWPAEEDSSQDHCEINPEYSSEEDFSSSDSESSSSRRLGDFRRSPKGSNRRRMPPSRRSRKSRRRHMTKQRAPAALLKNNDDQFLSAETHKHTHASIPNFKKRSSTE